MPKQKIDGRRWVPVFVGATGICTLLGGKDTKQAAEDILNISVLPEDLWWGVMEVTLPRAAIRAIDSAKGEHE